jgi:predicted MFS family arabinose efflux permease
MKPFFHAEDCGISLVCRCGTENGPVGVTPHSQTLDRKSTRAPSPAAVALAGLTAAAVAMGIGRFAFTPILPMMQQDFGLSMSDGGWLASANYLGFLFGAVSAISVRVRSTTAVRVGLVVIAIVTLGMGLTTEFAIWIILRALAGIANAWAQVFTFAWCLEKLAAVRRPLLNGVVFAGVGVGMTIAGGFCLFLMEVNGSSAEAWIGLALLSLIATAAIWRIVGADEDATAGEERRPTAQPWQWNVDSLRLVLCFGASGFGYIIPATFLPAMARQFIPDPLVFGWSWPVFGAAAAVAPLATAGWARVLGNRHLWILSHLVMALGVALPVRWPAIGGIMIAALLVGATFMINAMASMEEAQSIAGPNSTRLMAALIAAFGTGQMVGPMLVSYVIGPGMDFSKPLLIASVVLIASVYALAREPAAKQARSPDRNLPIQQ